MDLVGGGVDSRGGYVSKILYVKMKELGSLGGARTGHAPLDPPMERLSFCADLSETIISSTYLGRDRS